MKSRIAFVVAITAAVAFLSGCVSPPQQPIELAPTAFSGEGNRVGVIMTALPKVDTQFPGAGCLLCMATASAANSSLTKYTQTLTYEDLPQLKNNVAELLRKKGVNVTVIPDELKLDTLSDTANPGPNISRKDFSSFKKKYDIEKLLVIQVSQLGVLRTYSAYVPTSDPKGMFKGAGYLVNLKDNTYEWYLPVDILKSVEGKWDEAPQFPGVTNAYFQALETGKDSFIKPLSN